MQISSESLSCSYPHFEALGFGLVVCSSMEIELWNPTAVEWQVQAASLSSQASGNGGTALGEFVCSSMQWQVRLAGPHLPELFI